MGSLKSLIGISLAVISIECNFLKKRQALAGFYRLLFLSGAVMNKSVLPLGLDSVSLAKPSKKNLFIEQDKLNREGFAEHLSQSQRKLSSEQLNTKPRLNRMEKAESAKPSRTAERLEKAIQDKPNTPNESRLKDKKSERSDSQSVIASEKSVSKAGVSDSTSAQKNELTTDSSEHLETTHASEVNSSDTNNSENPSLEKISSEMILEETKGQELTAPDLLAFGVTPEINQILQSDADDVDISPLSELALNSQEEGDSLGGLFLSETIGNEIETLGDGMSSAVTDSQVFESRVLSESHLAVPPGEARGITALVDGMNLDVIESVDRSLTAANPTLLGTLGVITDAEVASVVESPLSMINSVKLPQTSISTNPLNNLDANGIMLPAESISLGEEEGENSVMDFTDLPIEGKSEEKPNKADLFKTLLAQSSPEKTSVITEKAAVSVSPSLQAPQAQQLLIANRLFVPQAQIGMHVAHPQWGHAVGEKIMWMANQQLSSADIRLDPPELGSLQVKVNVQQDQANITFISPHPQVRELLDQQVARLREMFAEQGLNLGSVDVSDRREQESRDSNEDSKTKGRFVGEESEEVQVTGISSLYLVDQFV